MQGKLSRALFRRPPLSGQETFTVLSLHISHIYAKKRSIAKKLILTIRAIMIGQQIDMVAGDFNGTAWRCSNRDNISTIDEAFSDCALPTPLGREREKVRRMRPHKKHPCAFRAEPTHANPAQKELEKNLKTNAQKLQIL